MSLTTWKKEFAPPLRERATRLEMCQASLKKWIGLRGKALKKHQVRISDGPSSVYDPITDERWGVSGHCRFCKRYEDACRPCPLCVARDQSCDRPYGRSPWGTWVEDANPEPMIHLLRKACKKLIAEADRRLTKRVLRHGREKP